MSAGFDFEFINQVYAVKAPLVEKAILVRLAFHAGSAQGVAYPTVQRLANDTSMSRRSAKNALHALAEKGLVSTSGRHPSGATVYRIHLDAATFYTEDEYAHPEPDRNRGARGSTGGARPAPRATHEGGHVVPLGGQEIPSGGQEIPSGGHVVPVGGAGRAPKLPENYQELPTNHQRGDAPARSLAIVGGTDPEVTRIQETAARCWSVGKSGYRINMAQIRAVQDLMDRFVLQGRPRDAVLQVMEETAGLGKDWRIFILRAGDVLNGTARPSTGTPAASAPRNRSAAMDQLRRSQAADWSPEADAWAAERDWVSLRPLTDFSPEELALARVAG